ncbi:60S ribosomal export protein NMD3 [Gryllus bimaculatus]|nr:60S ribosomal export protein NMD3 [Gryllus bimaculatus]
MMEYIDGIEETTPRILCCQCGTVIEPNAANMCVACLRSRIDITEGIPKQAIIHFCKGCERYLKPPCEWVACSLESRELLSVCLFKLKGLNRVRLVDAGFVWTEPHSKRIKVKLTVQGEVLGGAVLQQVFVVEFTVNSQMCEDCHHVEAQDYWRALVQVRQKCDNKKTFFYLEQLILKHKAHEQTLGIKPIHEAHARKLVDFLQAVLPCRYQQSKKLISHDTHSNTYNYKFTYSSFLTTVNVDGQGRLDLLTKAMGPDRQVRVAEVSAVAFWRNPFYSICNPKQLTEYIVMDVEIMKNYDQKTFPGQGAISQKHVLADVWVVRASDLGRTENTVHTRSHLGHVLKPGDSVLGYALGDSNVNDSNFEKLNPSQVPDVVLVKKYYGINKSARQHRRRWKLKHLNEEYSNLQKETNDYIEFLDDLEEDREYRQNINIFKDTSKLIPIDTDEIDDPTLPQITLEEMLDEMTIEEVEMKEIPES